VSSTSALPAAPLQLADFLDVIPLDGIRFIGRNDTFRSERLREQARAHARRSLALTYSWRGTEDTLPQSLGRGADARRFGREVSSFYQVPDRCRWPSTHVVSPLRRRSGSASRGSRWRASPRCLRRTDSYVRRHVTNAGEPVVHSSSAPRRSSSAPVATAIRKAPTGSLKTRSDLQPRTPARDESSLRVARSVSDDARARLLLP
jgi:hypothetical protein